MSKKMLFNLIHSNIYYMVSLHCRIPKVNGLIQNHPLIISLKVGFNFVDNDKKQSKRVLISTKSFKKFGE